MRIFKNFNNKSVLIISFIFFGIFLTPFFMQAVSSFRNGYFETGIFIIAMILLIILSSLYSFYTMPYAGLDQSSLTIFRGKRQKSIRFNEIKEIRITRRKKKDIKLKFTQKILMRCLAIYCIIESCLKS